MNSSSFSAVDYALLKSIAYLESLKVLVIALKQTIEKQEKELLSSLEVEIGFRLKRESE